MKRSPALPELLKTGIPTIDNEHQTLFDQLNSLSDNTEVQPDSAEFSEALSRLSGNLIDHFANEEKVMRSVGVPAELLARHMDAHNEVIEQITQMCFDLMRRKTIGRDQALERVRSWIVRHLTEYDMKLRAYKDCIQPVRQTAG
jgi:hemerythrin-like metal-binding protein